MYVPTSYNGNFRYGPHREYHDLVYYYWQESFLKQFIKIFNPKKLIKKIHKKDTLAPKQNLLNISYEKEKDFFELVDQSNLFIFDYPSTAFTYAAATNKPIIYLDIGLRKISNSAKKVFSKGVYIQKEILKILKL